MSTSHQVLGMGILREEFGGVSRPEGEILFRAPEIFRMFWMSAPKKSRVFRMSISDGVSVEGVVSSYQSLDGETYTRVWSNFPLR